MKGGVASVALAHHVAQLMHHLPYGLVTLAANLALYLLGGYGTLCRRQKEHGSKPVTNRQMTALHYRTGTKLHLMFAIHARPGLVARIPAQAQTAALTTEQTVMFTETAVSIYTKQRVRIYETELFAKNARMLPAIRVAYLQSIYLLDKFHAALNGFLVHRDEVMMPLRQSLFQAFDDIFECHDGLYL